ncbi:Shedu anti-phage system protein SduA domain-containing protein [Micromonospora sp. AKA38]|uniref:Shedu anti-phage system protein SduA domain-containing protein n=1 Tax=Micromonospora sp. AKA38 TaxID=2733861 RepID=UPI0024903203|nr:Shedu anti-phage system protein SduA domain-containing protein [Micromonospora sp. AKA38]
MIKKIVSLGVSDHVGSVLQDVLRHMGERSPYRGGKELVSLLRYAESAARQEQDALVSERIEDALAYAMNTMLRPDIEIKYQLFEGARWSTLRFVRNTFDGMSKLVLKSVEDFLSDNPTASAAEVQAHLVEFFDSAKETSESEEQPGHYRILRGMREHSAWFSEVLSNRLVVEGPSEPTTHAAGHRPAEVERLSLDDLVRLAQIRARTAGLRELRAVVHNPHSSEHDLQSTLERNLWIFGGSFLPALGRRRLVAGDELDIPLLRPDGSLHVVELKKANLAIMTRQRRGLIPNAEVHRAVGQVMNYLLALDEDRSRILDQHGVDVRRASATVVIGHPRFQPSVEEADTNEVLRTYSSHLARIEVVTYKQLLDGAERALSLA